MTVADFSGVVLLVSAAAGFLGALTGLGGGVVVTPVLTLLFGVNLHYAMGASLVSVIATSSGAAAAYVKEGFSNVRVGMLLEIATTAGAVVGAHLVSIVPVQVLAIVFAAVLLYSAWNSLSEKPAHRSGSGDPLAERLRLSGSYPGPAGAVAYSVGHVKIGFGLMAFAGLISGLLGIGSGAMKVVAMDQAMRIPFKVSTATSNFMIGVTAAASAGIYLRHGYIQAGLAMPVMLGVLGGSLLGARLLARAHVGVLRKVFAGVIAMMAVEMVYSGLTGGHAMTDYRLEQIVGNLLRAGVTLAAAVVLAGGVWYLADEGRTVENYHTFHGTPGTMPWTQGLSAPLATIQIGLLLLIATPVARVVFSLAAFAVERDRVYVGVTALVLAILAYSLLVS